MNMSPQETRAALNFIQAEYLDCDFRYPSPEPTGAEKLRDQKQSAMEIYTRDKESWNRESGLKKIGTWENHLAYELALVLEKLGVATLCGGIPLPFLVELAGDQVLEDWLLCYQWVKEYREEMKLNSPEGTPFHRRHAECIALISDLWMVHPFQAWKARDKIEAFSPSRALHDLEKLYESQGGIRSYCEKLLKVEKPRLPPATIQEIAELTGIQLG